MGTFNNVAEQVLDYPERYEAEEMFVSWFLLLKEAANRHDSLAMMNYTYAMERVLNGFEEREILVVSKMAGIIINELVEKDEPFLDSDMIRIFKLVAGM